MRILYHHRIASRDGMDVHISELIQAFRALGHEIHVVSPALHKRADFGQGGELLNAIRHRFPKQIGECLELAYDHVAYHQLEHAYKTFAPDVLYERANLFLSAGLRLKKKYGLPLLLEVNAPLFIERSEHGGLGMPVIANRMEQNVWRGADFAFPVSTVLARIMQEGGVNADRIRVLPNGVNVALFNPDISGAHIRNKFNIADGIVLGFCGFVREWHRIDLLLELASRLKTGQNLHVLIVGDGPACEGLRGIAESLGITEQVHFAGIVNRNEVANYIAAFDIAFQPAATRYASPLKLVEYLAMGKPVVAPRIANIIETVGSAGAVSYFDEGNDDGMISAVRRLLENFQEAKCEAIRQAAKVRQWKDNAKDIIETAMTLVESRSNPPRLSQLK